MARVRTSGRIAIQSRFMSVDDEPVSVPRKRGAWQAAVDYGIDVSQTRYLLTLTPAERLRRHERALDLVRAMRQAGIDYYGFDPRLPETAERARG